jgi:hypothetical protein
MKKRKVLAALMAVSLTASLTVAVSAAAFEDTTGHWAEESIARWQDAGVVNGTSDTTFEPNGQMTRAGAAQTFANLLKLDGTADLSNYTDVTADAWYANAIAACVEKGILSGVSDDQMAPNSPVTREMFFVMFGRALGLEPENTLNGNYTDSANVSSWASGYVNALINHGYVNGTSGNTISPDANINRASVMALLDQTIVAYVVEDGTVNVDENGVVLVLAKNATVTGGADVTVTVAAKDAKVSLKGFTGTATVVIKEDNVAITDAPNGTKITVAEGVDGATVNGSKVSADTTMTLGGTTTGGTSGGVVSGGGDGGDDDKDPGSTGDTPSTPGTTPGTTPAGGNQTAG